MASAGDELCEARDITQADLYRQCHVSHLEFHVSSGLRHNDPKIRFTFSIAQADFSVNRRQQPERSYEQEL
jgi:hypothetical protein